MGYEDEEKKKSGGLGDWFQNVFRIASDEELIANAQQRSGRSHISDNASSRFDTVGDVYKEIGLKVSNNKDSIRAERGVAEAMNYAGELNRMSDDDFLAMRAEQGISPREVQASNPEALQGWIAREKNQLRQQKAEELTKQYGNSARDSVKGNAFVKGATGSIVGGLGGGLMGGVGGAFSGVIRSFEQNGLIAGAIWAVPYAAVDAIRGSVKRGFQGSLAGGAAGTAYGAHKAVQSGTGKGDYAEVMLNAMKLADERHAENLKNPNQSMSADANAKTAGDNPHSVEDIKTQTASREKEKRPNEVPLYSEQAKKADLNRGNKYSDGYQPKEPSQEVIDRIKEDFGEKAPPSSQPPQPSVDRPLAVIYADIKFSAALLERERSREYGSAENLTHDKSLDAHFAQANTDAKEAIEFEAEYLESVTNELSNHPDFAAVRNNPAQWKIVEEQANMILKDQEQRMHSKIRESRTIDDDDINRMYDAKNASEISLDGNYGAALDVQAALNKAEKATEVNPYEAILTEELGDTPAAGERAPAEYNEKIDKLADAFGLSDNQLHAVDSARRAIDASQETARAQFQEEGAKIIPLNPNKASSQSRA